MYLCRRFSRHRVRSWVGRMLRDGNVWGEPKTMQYLLPISKRAQTRMPRPGLPMQRVRLRGRQRSWNAGLLWWKLLPTASTQRWCWCCNCNRSLDVPWKKHPLPKRPNISLLPGKQDGTNMQHLCDGVFRQGMFAVPGW